MGVQLAELPINAYGVAGFVASIIVITKLSQRSKLDIFPTAGSNDWLGSWWASLRSLTNAQGLIQATYEKHNPAPFKFADPSFWTVILSDRRHLEELAKASDDEFSFQEAIHAQLQTKYTLGPEIVHNPYHIGIVRSRLNRNLEVLYPEIRDEAVASFDEVLNLSGHEWKSVVALHAMERVICRMSNRAFVGLPLCRNADWIDLNIRFTVDVVRGGVIVGLFPKFLRPLAVRFLTNLPRSFVSGLQLLGPIIEERRKYLNEYGEDWDDKPNDLLSWLMDEAEGPEQAAECLTNRMLVVNFAAVHTSSNSLTQALFHLAANPQYIQPIREEVEDIVKKDGWTKAALTKMHKVDSFLKECLRIEGLNLTTMSRMALKDFTFSDGTFIPKGTLVAASSQCLHHDERFYSNADAFEPFRFVDLHGEDGKGQTHQYASTTTEYLPFGLGRHACAGRFFAATELKSVLAHVVMTYDVKLEDDADRPSSWNIATFVSADPHAKIMFRNRVR